MLVKPIGALVKTKKDPTTMTYLGIVEDNKDPKKLGRVKVRIDLFSDYSTEDLPWSYPILSSCGNNAMSGGINVPEVGSEVRVSFPSRDLTAPYYSGAELNERNRQTLFDEDYPDTYGYKDSRGNFIKVNKKKGTVHLQHSSNTNLFITSDGSVNLTLRNGASFNMTSQNSFSLSIAGVSIIGMPDGSLEIKNDSDISIKALSLDIDVPEVTTTGGLKVGNGYSGKLWLVNGVATVTNGIITSVEGI